MGSRKRSRKQNKQQTLAFEPVSAAASASASASPLRKGLSPARVRVSTSTVVHEGSSPSGSGRLVKAVDVASTRTRKSKKQQQTLETSLGNIRTRSSGKQSSPDDDSGGNGLPSRNVFHGIKVRQRVVASPPPSSFMPKSRKGGRVKASVDSDSESSVEEEGGVDDSDGEGPLKQETPRRATARMRKIVAPSSDSDGEDNEDDGETPAHLASSQSLSNQLATKDDSDDEPLATPRSSMPRTRAPQTITLQDSEDEDSEDIQSPAKRRRLGKGRAAPANTPSDSDDAASTQDESEDEVTSKNNPSSPPASKARSMRSKMTKRHRTEKEKRMELLRRRRAGEKNLTMEDLQSLSDEDDGQGGLYDTDSELEVLEVFDDESEPETEAPTSKKGKRRDKKKQANKSLPELLDEDANTEDENFIDDEDDTIGVPDEALAQIPLEFTRASRKPLKAHFKDAIEWLVHRKINPAFDRDNEVYATAWRRLSDEVTGLANSKFVSSVWKPDFYKALRARPYIVQQELGAGLATEFQSCQACGRSGHPATWSISFQGKPYDNKTLDEVESDSEDSSEEGDRDAEGNSIPFEDKEFYVGQTCNSNAGTAHNLIHWKPALRDWVDDRLEQDGWLAPDKIVEREKMKPKKRHKVADEIVEIWEQFDFLRTLFLDFKQNIETARNMDPTKVARGGRRY